MCGRAYETYTEEELEARYQWNRLKRKPLGLKPNYNMAPTQLSPVVIHDEEGETNIELFRWGLIPAWAKDIKSASKYSLINARAEEITEKRSYKVPFQKRRCILPLSGFVEWKREGEGNKRPFAIHLKDNSIMSVAALWESWTPPEGGDSIRSFSIVTTAANSFMEAIHDRMPVILDSGTENAWLDPKEHDAEKLKAFLRPCAHRLLAAYEISTRINSPKNNSSELLAPV